MIIGTFTVTLTREEIVEELKKQFKSVLHDSLDDIWIDDECRMHTLDLITRLSNVGTWCDEELIQSWDELCSEAFFNNMKDVDDVMMRVEITGGPINKIWIASRPVK